MVLSACALKDDRKRTGRDEKTTQGEAEGLLAGKRKLFQRGNLFSVIWTQTLTGLPLLARDLQMTTKSSAKEDNPSDLSWEINEPERRAALTVRRFLAHRRVSAPVSR